MTCASASDDKVLDPPLVQCAILSTWSHTLGPQVLFTWSPDEHSPVSLELSRLTARLLHSDILANADQHPCSIRCKVLVLSKHQVILHSRIFHSPEWECPLALTLIYNYSQLCKVWSFYRVTEIAITRMVKALRKCKTTSVSRTVIQKRMQQFRCLLSRLHTSSQNTDKATLKNSCIRWDSEYVVKCLVSHLQTSGCTLVIGNNELHLSKLPEFLLHFLSKKEQACSISQVPDESWYFAPGAHLQTLKKINYEKTEDLFRDLKLNTRIPTIIDLERLKVKQFVPKSTSPIDEEYLPESKNQLKSITELGTIVPDFMEQLALTDPDEMLHIFKCHLLLKGAISAKIMQDSCPKVGQLKGMLGVMEDADLKVIMGSTNKMRPRFT